MAIWTSFWTSFWGYGGISKISTPISPISSRTSDIPNQPMMSYAVKSSILDWVEDEDAKKVLEYVNTKAKTPEEKKLLLQDAHQEAIKITQAKQFQKDRETMKAELMKRTAETKNEAEKKSLWVSLRIANLSDIIRDWAKKEWIDVSKFNDQDLIAEHAKANPWFQQTFIDYLNWTKSSVDVWKELGLIQEEQAPVEEEGMWWVKTISRMWGNLGKWEWINPVWKIFESLDDLTQKIPTLSTDERDEFSRKNLWWFGEWMWALPTMLVNAIPSFLKTATGIARWVTNPLDTVTWLTKLIFTPEWHQALADRYGSLDAFYKTMTEDPVWLASDALTIIEWWAGIAGKAGKLAGLTDISKTAGKASTLWVWDILTKWKNIAIKSTEWNKLLNTIVKTAIAPTEPLKTLVSWVSKITPTADTTIQRMNRLTKWEQEKFKNMAGEEVWEWLNNRWIVDTPENTVMKTAEYFKQSKDQVDKWLEAIDWKFQNEDLTLMLDDSVRYAENTRNPELKRIQELQSKNTTEWLSMPEINEIKRFFERNNKFSYWKDLTAWEKTARATNVDNAVRERQMKVAEENGFTNLKELNKETQASRFIMDKLAKNESGRLWNNAVTITDWIVAAPAMVDPTLLAWLVTKKILQSNWFTKNYAKIVNKLNWHKNIANKVADMVSIGKIQNEKQLNEWLSKQALPLKEWVENVNTIIMPDKKVRPLSSNINDGTSNIGNGGNSDNPSGISRKVKNETITQPSVMMKAPEEPLMAEARKYKSAEEFIENQIYKDRKTMWFKDYHSAPEADIRPIDKRIDDAGNFSLQEIAEWKKTTAPLDFFDERVWARYYWYNNDVWIESYTALNNIFRAEKNWIKWRKITAYRAVPKDIKVDKLVNWDWITFSKKYAEKHWESRFDWKYKIIKEDVSPSDVRWDVNDINERWYDNWKWYKRITQDTREKQLKQIREEANSSKSPIDPLIQEARKYKSADSFIKDIKELPTELLRNEDNLSKSVEKWVYNLNRTRQNLTNYWEFSPQGTFDSFVENIKKNWIQEPIKIDIWKDWKIIIWDWSHRLLVAEELWIKNVPVEIRNVKTKSNILKQIREEANKKKPLQPKPLEAKATKPLVSMKTPEESLMAEARKYKSAEEFIKNQTLYHWTSNKIEWWALWFGKGSQLRKWGSAWWLFLSDNPKVADVFSFGWEVYQANPAIKSQVLDLTKQDNINLFKDYIGKKYQSDWEMLEFTKQDFDYMFPEWKVDFATLNQDLAQQIAKKQGKIWVAFDEYAWDTVWKTYQIFEWEVPVYTKSQLKQIREEANKSKKKI